LRGNGFKVRLTKKKRSENLSRGRAEGEREIVKGEVIDEEKHLIGAMAERIVEKLKSEDGQSVRDLKRSLRRNRREIVSTKLCGTSSNRKWCGVKTSPPITVRPVSGCGCRDQQTIWRDSEWEVTPQTLNAVG
jgi:hypothetical protein